MASKAKAVRRLAARVLNLRVKVLSALRNRQAPAYDEEAAREAERSVRAAGVENILEELGASDAL